MALSPPPWPADVSCRSAELRRRDSVEIPRRASLSHPAGPPSSGGSLERQRGGQRGRAAQPLAVTGERRPQTRAGGIWKMQGRGEGPARPPREPSSAGLHFRLLTSCGLAGNPIGSCRTWSGGSTGLSGPLPAGLSWEEPVSLGGRPGPPEGLLPSWTPGGPSALQPTAVPGF